MPLDNYTFGDFVEIEGKNFSGESRDSLSLFYGLDQQKLYIFGGKATTNNSVLGRSNILETWSVDVNTLQWNKLKQTLNSSGHCTVQLKKKNLLSSYDVYIFGGVGSSSNALQGLNLSAIEAGQGFSVVNTTAPAGHELYPACTVDNEGTFIYVFGGASESNPTTCNNEMMVYNISSKLWQVITLNVNATRPYPRKGATLEAIYNKNKLQFLVLIGGEPCGPVGEYHAIWWFNVSSNEWIQANENSTSSHIAYHSSTTTHESGVIVVYGGQNIENGQLNQGLFIYTTLNQTWSPSPSWFAPKLSNALPVARAKHSSVYSNQRILYYGASDANSLLQLSISAFCSMFDKNCGNCILYPGCGYCTSKSSNVTHCVPGTSQPYISSQCATNLNNTFYNISGVDICRITHDIPALLPVTIVVIVLIFALVLATYFVDWRMKKKKALHARGYEYIQ